MQKNNSKRDDNHDINIGYKKTHTQSARSTQGVATSISGAR